MYPWITSACLGIFGACGDDDARHGEHVAPSSESIEGQSGTEQRSDPATLDPASVEESPELEDFPEPDGRERLEAECFAGERAACDALGH